MGTDHRAGLRRKPQVARSWAESSCTSHGKLLAETETHSEEKTEEILKNKNHPQLQPKRDALLLVAFSVLHSSSPCLLVLGFQESEGQNLSVLHGVASVFHTQPLDLISIFKPQLAYQSGSKETKSPHSMSSAGSRLDCFLCEQAQPCLLTKQHLYIPRLAMHGSLHSRWGSDQRCSFALTLPHTQ